MECVLDGCTTEEDIVHTFRVAAMNEVGRGPYSMPVTFTQKKACEFKEDMQEVFISPAYTCTMIIIPQSRQSGW